MKDSEVKKFKKYAKNNSTEMFVKSLFPDKFKGIVTQCFLDNNEAFQKLFNDPDFYQKVQDAMATELYKSLRKDWTYKVQNLRRIKQRKAIPYSDNTFLPQEECWHDLHHIPKVILPELILIR